MKKLVKITSFGPHLLGKRIKTKTGKAVYTVVEYINNPKSSGKFEHILICKSNSKTKGISRSFAFGWDDVYFC